VYTTWHVTLDQLKTFLLIVASGSVRGAAEQLHVTQPALSARLAALEQSLGTTLFERRSQGLVLTKAGADLVPLAQQMLDLQGRIKSTITPEDRLSGLLRIGAAETIAQAWLPALVSAVQGRYQSLSIEVSVDISLNLRDQLLDRSIDLAILMGPVSEYSTENIELPSFRLGWFMAPDQTDAGLPDLAHVPVVTYARNTRPFRELKTALTERHGPQVRLFPSSSLSACFEMVAAGLGVGVLPERLAQARVETGELVPFDPGWTISPLRFTASYVAEPASELVRQTARMAHAIASEHA
jgi:DNA-binding transcriptional LysR family regulator